jgi:ATP-binding cassette, subfamily G (WHITE), member 2, PDR
MPRFVTQRSLYEVRERPSKAYSWSAFIITNLIVEIPWQVLLGIVVWASWYFPIFGAQQSTDRQDIFLLYCIQFSIFSSTFAQMVIRALPNAETADNIATLVFAMCLTFNGVLQTPNALPGFWLFMYRVSPLTYLVGGWAATGIHSRQVRCASDELAIFDPPSGETCGQYLQNYLTTAQGQLYNPSATTGSEYCPLSNGDQFLAGANIAWVDRWRNFGIGWAYIVFNVFVAVALYYVFREKSFSRMSLKKSQARSSTGSY